MILTIGRPKDLTDDAQNGDVRHILGTSGRAVIGLLVRNFDGGSMSSKLVQQLRSYLHRPRKGKRSHAEDGGEVAGR